MFKTLTKIIAAVALLVSLASTSMAADSKKPIRIPVTLTPFRGFAKDRKPISGTTF